MVKAELFSFQRAESKLWLKCYPPAPLSFNLGTPKIIGILLGLCSIILVSYNGLGRTVFPSARGEQNIVKAPSPLLT